MPTYPLKKLSEICEISIGKTPPRWGRKFWDTEKTTSNVWLSIADLSNCDHKVISDSKEYISDLGASLFKSVEKWTLLVSFKLTLWRLAFAGRELRTNEAIAALKIKDDKKVDKYYLYYSLSFFDWIAACKGDTKVKWRTLNKAKLREIEIPLPPLSVQEEIVAKLDSALASIDEAKTKTQQALAATRELWESTLEEAFRENNWEVKKLGELWQITSSKRIYKKEYVKNGIPFYRIKEIKELAHDKDISIELYISNDRYNEIKETFGIPQEGDLLMTAVGTIGEIYTVKKDDIFYFKDGNVLWFRKFNSINPHFLKLILLSFVENIKKLSIGSAYNALTIEKLENYTISIPSLSKQSRIVAHLDAVRAETDRLAALYEQKLADLDELRRSVLQEAFA
jgi:type I restriction enzyme S subunit